MARVLENGHKQEWNITVRCKLCKCLYAAEWDDFMANPYPSLHPEHGNVCCACPQCGNRSGFDNDPRAHHSKVAEFVDEAIRLELPVTDGIYR